MKKIIVLLVIVLSVIIFGQPQLENNLDNDFRTVSYLAKQIVGWFFIIIIVIFSIGATVMNLSRKDKKDKQTEP